MVRSRPRKVLAAVQRVVIAGAMVLSPSLLVADEPVLETDWLAVYRERAKPFPVARTLFDDGVEPLELVQARALLSAAGLALLPAAWRRPSKPALCRVLASARLARLA